MSPMPCFLSDPLQPKWDIRSSHLLWSPASPPPPGDREDEAQVWKQQIPQRWHHSFPFQNEQRRKMV